MMSLTTLCAVFLLTATSCSSAQLSKEAAKVMNVDTEKEETLFNQKVDAFFAATGKHDTKAMKALFNPKVLASDNHFDKDVSALYESYSGPLPKYDHKREIQGDYSNDYGSKTAKISDWFPITMGNNKYYLYMDLVYRNDPEPKDVGICTLDLVPEKVHDGKYFIWPDEPGLNVRKQPYTDQEVMLLYGNARKYTPVNRNLTEQTITSLVKHSSNYKELVRQIGPPNGELLGNEYVFRLADSNSEKRYAVCDVSSPDTITKITVVSETKELNTIWESPAEKKADSENSQ